MNNGNKSGFFSELVESYGNEKSLRMGPYASYAWVTDPKHYLFSLARYKFCSKIFEGLDTVLDIGCGDAAGDPLLLQTVNKVIAIDINSDVIEYNKKNNSYSKIVFSKHNMILSNFPQKCDAALSLDVIEHISQQDEFEFLKNISLSVKKYSPVIIGTPNITACKYASAPSKKEHINLKSYETLKNSLYEHFYTVIIFSMNDEVVHTGFSNMAHYLIAIAIGSKY